MVDASLLAGTGFFGALPLEAVEAIAAAATTRRLKRNDLLCRAGEPAHEMFVVQDGRIAIANRSADGKESVFALMEVGDLLGEMGLFDGQRSADARALEPSSVVVVPYDAVRAVLEERPALLWHLVELLCDRLRAVDEALADSVFLDVTGRTAKRLLDLAGDADEFQLPVTQEELAGMIGASRERVNKAIALFIRLGWLEQSERRYRVLDREQLARRAQQ